MTECLVVKVQRDMGDQIEQAWQEYLESQQVVETAMEELRQAAAKGFSLANDLLKDDGTEEEEVRTRVEEGEGVGPKCLYASGA